MAPSHLELAVGMAELFEEIRRRVGAWWLIFL